MILVTGQCDELLQSRGHQTYCTDGTKLRGNICSKHPSDVTCYIFLAILSSYFFFTQNYEMTFVFRQAKVIGCPYFKLIKSHEALRPDTHTQSLCGIKLHMDRNTM